MLILSLPPSFFKNTKMKNPLLISTEPSLHVHYTTKYQPLKKFETPKIHKLV